MLRRALVLATLTIGAFVGARGVAGQDWKDVTISRRLDSTAPVRAQVSYGAGTFSLRSTDERLLYRMSLRYDEQAFEPRADYTGNRLILGLQGTGGRFSIPRTEGSGSMELELARGVPMDLDLEFGAVKANVDLGGLSLTKLQLSTGASESLIEVSEPNPGLLSEAEFEVGAADFTVRSLGNLGTERIDVHAGVGRVALWLDGAWRTNARLSIDMGLGALELHVPEGLGLRIRNDSFLTSFDPEGLVKRGDSYYSLDWEEAERNVTIDLNAAFGSVQVLWIR